MNVKDEFLNEVEYKEVLCASIQCDKKELILTTGWTDDEFKEFIISLDFKYDSGYGGQELFGLIWYKDGSWSERGEYDGSEWWDYKKSPEIPENLNRIDKVREEKLNKILKP